MDEWRAVPGWEGFYEASRSGKIKGVQRTYRDRWGNDRTVHASVLRPTLIDGYEHVSLSSPAVRRTRSVHRLVLEAFRGKRPYGHQARHLNGNRADNRLENLEWSLPVTNIRDKQVHGTQTRGSDIVHSKLTESSVREILARATGGEARSSIAASFGVDAETVRHICRGKTWKHLDATRPGNRKSRERLTDDEVREIRRRLMGGETETVLGRAFRLPWKSVNLIRRGITYTDVR